MLRTKADRDLEAQEALAAATKEAEHAPRGEDDLGIAIQQLEAKISDLHGELKLADTFRNDSVPEENIIGTGNIEAFDESFGVGIANESGVWWLVDAAGNWVGGPFPDNIAAQEALDAYCGYDIGKMGMERKQR